YLLYHCQHYAISIDSSFVYILMNIDKFLLAQNIAFMISIPPEINLAKLLSFCLAAKARDNTPATEILKITCFVNGKSI
ncbi:MAG: hypothetical protein PUP93_31525, partial [Rhizonema sp. NSF051]|nr:hypothetical protein [Rhizonema sp. NSF051]